MNAKRKYLPEPRGVSGYVVTIDGHTISVFYDRSYRLWTAFEVDENLYQVGLAGYGPSRDDAVDDVLATIAADASRSHVAAAIAAAAPSRRAA